MKIRENNATKNHDATREAAILQNVDLVNNLAKRLQRRLPPCVTFDDLRSAGMIGLIEAIDRFDASRGLELRNFAQHRISGAMLDFLRAEDPLSRAERRRLRDSGSTATGPVTVSLDQMPSRLWSRMVGIHDHAAEASLLRSELREMRQCLSAREDRVIALLFESGWRNSQVAAVLKVNESRVSQIKQRALMKLRRYFEPATVARAA
jgi:RNA polymerase sigma factor (sigma-70 family)